MKRVGLVLLLIFLMSFISAEIEVHNTSNVVLNYLPGESLRGEINLSFSELSLSTVLESKFGETINFIELLERNYLDYNCNPNDCKTNYRDLMYSSDRTFLELDLMTNDKRYAGFILEGDEVYISDFDFNVFSNFEDSEKMPLNLVVFDEGGWNYTESSSVHFKESNFGEFNSSKDLTDEDLFFDNTNVVSDVLYCSNIYLNDTGLIRVGGLIQGSDSKSVRMKLFKENDFSSSGIISSCEYSPIEEDYCEIKTQIYRNLYSLCLDSKSDVTNYFLLYENKSSLRTSYIYRDQEKNFVNKNFGLFVNEAYFNYSTYDDELDLKLNFEEIANNYLTKKYNNDCTNKCFLPIEINSKINLDLLIKGVDLRYTHSSGASNTNEVSELLKIPATYSFDGVVDLSKTGFSELEDGEYSLFLDDFKIFEEDINVSSVPLIKYINPLKVPVSKNVTLNAVGNFDQFSNLTFIWKFSDGFFKNTSINNITRDFDEIINYNVNLTIKNAIGDYSPLFTTQIQVVLPSKEFLYNQSQDLFNSLNKAKESLEDYMQWAREEILEKLNFDTNYDELTIIQRRINLSQTQEERNEIFNDLYNLDVPKEIFVSGNYSFALAPDKEKINPGIIKEYNEDNIKYDLEKYITPINTWQGLNIDGLVEYYDISVVTHNHQINDVTRIYKIKFNTNYEDDYFMVIDEEINNLYFFDNLNQESIMDHTIIPFESKGEKEINFYVNSFSNLSFFFSPKLTNLVPKDVDIEIINHDEVKPLKEVIWLVVPLLFFVIFVYTLIQLWYSTNYEKKLFPDKRVLYNLMMFIDSAKKANLKNRDIKAKLIEQGWSNERISYAIRKFKGKQPLPEIIPINKIIQKIKYNKFKKKQSSQNNNSVSQNNMNRY